MKPRGPANSTRGPLTVEALSVHLSYSHPPLTIIDSAVPTFESLIADARIPDGWSPPAWRARLRVRMSAATDDRTRGIYARWIAAIEARHGLTRSESDVHYSQGKPGACR